MTGKKRYLQPFDMLLNAIHDLTELQKAKTIMCDSPHGIIRLLVTMYSAELEYCFTVLDVLGNRSDVIIALTGEGEETRRLIDHEFALLDYVLIDRTKIELFEIEEWDRKVLAESENKKAGEYRKKSGE
jgi:hypothetical protein